MELPNHQIRRSGFQPRTLYGQPYIVISNTCEKSIFSVILNLVQNLILVFSDVSLSDYE
jgi:hypothetical protein